MCLQNQPTNSNVSLELTNNPNVSPGRIYSDNCTCCHTEIEVADQAFFLTHSQYTDTGPTCLRITAGAWQGSHWSAILYSHWYDSTRKNPYGARIKSNPESSALGEKALTTRPTEREAQTSLGVFSPAQNMTEVHHTFHGRHKDSVIQVSPPPLYSIQNYIRYSGHGMAGLNSTGESEGGERGEREGERGGERGGEREGGREREKR